jgi:acyl carrier protein
MSLSDNDILAQLTEIFRDVFDDQTLVPEMNMTADDIPEWDSMSQVTLAVEVEHHFKVKFKSAEMEELRSVRDLVELIKSRATAAAA